MRLSLEDLITAAGFIQITPALKTEHGLRNLLKRPRKCANHVFLHFTLDLDLVAMGKKRPNRMTDDAVTLAFVLRE